MGIGERINGSAWLWLIAVNAGVFALEQVPSLTGPIFSYGALSPSNALSMPWAWVFSLFIHQDLLHIGLNMLALLVFGPLLEQKVGTRNFLLTYFAAGLVGNLGFILTAPSAYSSVVGASGAIYGVMAAAAVLDPNRVILLMFVPLPLWIATLVLLLLELTYAGIGPADSIAHYAHVFGILAGLALGAYFKKTPSEGDLPDWVSK